MNVQNVHSGGASLSDSAIEHRCSLPKKAMHLAKTCFRSGLRAFRSLEAMQPAVRSAVRWEWFLPSPVLQVVCPTIQSAYPEWVILLFPDWAVGIHPEGLPCRKLPRPDFIHRNVGMPVCLSIHSQPESFSPSILSSSPQHLFSASLWQQRARSTFNALSQQRRQILALLLSLSLCLFFFFFNLQAGRKARRWEGLQCVSRSGTGSLWMTAASLSRALLDILHEWLFFCCLNVVGFIPSAAF